MDKGKRDSSTTIFDDLKGETPRQPSQKSTIPSAQRKKNMGTRENSKARPSQQPNTKATPRPKATSRPAATGTRQGTVSNTGRPAPNKAAQGTVRVNPNGGGQKRRPAPTQGTTPQKGRAPQKGMSKAKRTILGIVILLVFGVVLIGGWNIYYTKMLEPVSSSTEGIIVEIPDGSTIKDVSQILYDSKLIKNSMIFESYAGRHSQGEKQIQAANYEFNQSMSSVEIFNKMLDGESYAGSVAIVIPEGRNIKEMGEILEKNHICTATDFIAETKKVAEYKAKYPILDSIPDGKDRALEGYLFADTYHWNSNTPASDVVTSMLNRFVDIFDTTMQSRTTEMGKTVDEIIIMSSIVELETKLPEDKANCASVFYNRIAQGMPLQSDITVDYALGTKNAVLTEAQTQTPSPYNTYLNLGLPVGPICSPSKTSIEAALHPATTNYLYFVADMNSGKLYFNETLEGHNADVEKYMGN